MTIADRTFSKALCCSLFAAVAVTAAAQDKSDAVQTKVLFSEKSAEQLELNYLLYLPKTYQADSDKKWPLVVFLHGAGERGDDLEKVKFHGPPKLVEAGKEFPFIVISPQCPKDSWWPYEPILKLIDDAEKRYHVDPERVYLTGLSMGGYGTWSFAAQAPNRFAAIAPICGGGTPYLMNRLPHLPVWAFHGGKDGTVPPVESERMVEALKKAGNKEAKLTIYPEAGHNSWTEAYNTEELYDWLLTHKRGQ